MTNVVQLLALFVTNDDVHLSLLIPLWSLDDYMQHSLIRLNWYAVQNS
jgi:hypothetical protein